MNDTRENTSLSLTRPAKFSICSRMDILARTLIRIAD